MKSVPKSPSAITVPQLRAARALIRWSQDDLADHSGVSKPTVARLELEEGLVGGYAATKEKLRHALESAGIIFVAENGEGPGVRLKKDRRDAAAVIEALDDEHARMAASPSPKKALNRMKAAIAKDGQRGQRKKS